MIKKIAKININKEIIDEITEALRDLLKNNLIKIVLYGSYARGDFNNLSDIDIFILDNCPDNRFLSFIKF